MHYNNLQAWSFSVAQSRINALQICAVAVLGTSLFFFLQVMEAEHLYKQCVTDAKIHQEELVKVKERIIAHIRKLIFQGDQVLKEVCAKTEEAEAFPAFSLHSETISLPPVPLQATVNMFYYQRQQTEPVPLGYHNLEVTCRSLEPGEPYLLYILSKRRPEQPLQVFSFQEYVHQGKGYDILTSGS